jgi:putative salt-induced outer membrane protein YdiY
MEAFSARQYDDVIVASFELTFYVDPTTCQPGLLRSLITDVWVRHPDGWRLQVRHSGPAPSAAAGIAAQYGLVPEPPPVWDVRGELSLVATAGTTSTHTLGLGSAATHRTDRTSTRASIAFLTSGAEEETQARSLSMQARYGIRISERTEMFGRGSYARDRFAGIDNRFTTEGGLAYAAVLSPRHALTTEGSIGFIVEQRLDASDLEFATATGTIHYVWTMPRGAEFTQLLGVTADLETARDWRGSSTTAFSVTVAQQLSLKASHAIEYRNTPVAGFGRLDMRTAGALVLSWRQRPGVP